jgi:hypothetical protein
MSEPKTGENLTTQTEPGPGAYLGRKPEREAETIPGGIEPEDERVAAYGSRPGADGEPEDLDLAGSPGTE